MTEVARALIRRVGPSTGNLYLGRDDKKAVRFKAGLVAMGLFESEILVAPRKEIQRFATDADHEPDINEGSDNISRLLTLTVTTLSDDGSRARKGNQGLIRGLNFAAIWICYAQRVLHESRSH